MLLVWVSPVPSQPRGRLPVAFSIVLSTWRMTSFSLSGASPARLSLLVVPCPMNSQPRFFISSMALGWVSQTCEFERDGRLDAHAIEHVSKTPEPDAHAVFAPGVVDDVGHAIGGIGRDAGSGRRIVVPDLHVGRDPDRERLVVGPGERACAQR